MASAFLAISAAAVCAPLNPSYRTDEFEFFLSDLNPKALIVQAGADSPAVAVARSLGIQIIELVQENDDVAGVFSLKGVSLSQFSLPFSRHADEAALILHTSGTTSRPRMVPLTQANLCTSARNIATSLQLRAGDTCLNVMPLFHIHGLVPFSHRLRQGPVWYVRRGLIHCIFLSGSRNFSPPGSPRYRRCIRQFSRVRPINLPSPRARACVLSAHARPRYHRNSWPH